MMAAYTGLILSCEAQKQIKKCLTLREGYHPSAKASIHAQYQRIPGKFMQLAGTLMKVVSGGRISYDVLEFHCQLRN